MPRQPDKTDQALASPDQLFPGWQSLEIFGVPGAGKSFYCRRFIGSQSVFSTCDDQIARYYADRTMGPAGRLLKQAAPQRAFNNYYRWRIKHDTRRFLAAENAGVARYFDSVDRAIGSADLSAGTQRNITQSVARTAAYLAAAQADGLKLLVDEGLLRKLATIIARSGGAAVAPALRSAILRCLKDYPWQRNALLLEAGAETALSRQHSRGHVISNPSKPIDTFVEAVEQLCELLVESGWRLVRLRND